MRKWLRRMRGAIGMGLAWGLAWFAAGMALLLIVGPDAADVPFPLGFGMFGFFSGVTFSGILGVAEGRRSFDQMSLPRFASWGAVGGFLLAATFVSVVALIEGSSFLWNLVVLGPIFAVAGSGSAAGALALARRAGDQELLETAQDAAGAGLGEGDVQGFLGDGG